jgi:beta-glucanase (GH16 family)
VSAGVAMAVGLVAAGATGAAALLSGGVSRHDATAAQPSPAKWKRVFTESFDGPLDRSSWGAYSGQPGGDPGGFWDPSHVRVRKGVLNLETYRDERFGGRWVSGGVSSSHALRQRYGKYLVRLRMDGGKGVAGIVLLWPVRDHWPPEIDLAETGGTSNRRSEASATLHYGAENRQIQRTVRADFTRWHTVGVEWTPRRLVYTIDGRRWASVRSPHVPSERMELDIQSQAGTCGDHFAPCPDSSTPAHVNLQVDRVTAYRYVAGKG